MTNVRDIIDLFFEIKNKNYIGISITDLHENILLSFCSNKDL